MKFTAAIAAAILAFGASARPMEGESYGYNATTTAKHTFTTSTYYPESTSTTEHYTYAPEPTPLTLTQQLFIADTAAKRFDLLPHDSQFVFSFSSELAKNAAAPTVGKGGVLAAANRAGFPALVGTGASMAVGKIGPCGINTYHVHPRGAELQLVIKGRLVTEMAPENGVNDPNDNTKRRVIRNELHELDMTPFYQGSVHSQYNPDCEDALFVAAFPTEDAGTGQIAQELFAFDNEVLSAVLGGSLDGADIDRVRHAIPASIARGVDECLTKCHIQKRSF